MAYVVFYWQAPGEQKRGLIYFVVAELSLVPGTQQVVQNVYKTECLLLEVTFLTWVKFYF